MTMRQDQTADGLSRLEKSLGDIDNIAGKLASVSDEQFSAALETALSPVAEKVRRDMIDNFKRAPVRRRTGKLAQAMEALIVEPMIRGRSVSISVRMPSNVSDYESKSGYKTPFYTAASAVNYGALRQGKERLLGEKAARTAKQAALGQRLSARQAKHQSKIGVVLDSKGLTIQGRKASVIAPRPFFYLTEAQRKEAEDMLNNEVEFALIQMLGG
jgi:hypothetical protein